jgi:benzoyl-CoA reductase/2-hydroxyglutaryl-CoA dehydratase subunit BcrC/BadD/HgdB
LEKDIRTVVAVMRGDCSNNEAMAAVLQSAGVEIIPFSYPYPKERSLLRTEIERLMSTFEVSWDAVNHIQRELDRIRGYVHRLDDLTWQQGAVSSLENHLWTVTCSDFNGDYRLFEQQISAFVAQKEKQAQDVEPRTRSVGSSRPNALRFGFVGVPPIFTDLYDYVESLGVKVVYNEMQRQFAMPGPPGRDLVQQYLDYTYPYDFDGRIADIRAEVALRDIDAIIHYVQSFCHHQIQDIILRQHMKLPILTLEGDRPGPLDARSKMRLEAFVDLCRQRALERRSV